METKAENFNQPSHAGESRQEGSSDSVINSRSETSTSQSPIEAQNNRLLTIFNHINDLICELDAEGIYLYVNNQYKDILGYDPEELIGKYAVELIHPEDLNTSISRFEELKKSRKNSTDIWRFRHKNGNYRIIESRGTLVDDGSIKPRTVVISRDITEQFMAEQAIVESERKYRGLYQSLIDGYAMVSLDGKILEFNEAFQSMLGYDHEELQSLTYLDITPAKWHKTEQYIIESQVLKTGYSEVYRKEYRKKDETVFPVELRVYLTHSTENQPSGMWAIVRDISEQIQADEEQLKMFQQLEAMSTLKDKFLSIMAHDLRGTFNSIIGYTDILKTSLEPHKKSDLNENIYRIQQASSDTYTLLENLLSWASSHSNTLKFEPQNIDLKIIVSQTIAFFDSAILLKNIHVDFNCSEPVTIEADIQMLKTMLRNLISNAVKFTTDHGTISIQINLVNQDALIQIENSSHTFKSESNSSSVHRSNTWYDFYEPEKGAGLGLTLVTEFAQLHGGRLETHFSTSDISIVSLILPLSRRKIMI